MSIQALAPRSIDKAALEVRVSTCRPSLAKEAPDLPDLHEITANGVVKSGVIILLVGLVT